MNKYRVAYIIVLVLFIITAITAFGTALLTGPIASLAVFWLPLLINGFLLYTLKDWKNSSDQVEAKLN